MPFEVIDTDLPQLKIIKPKVFADNRGFFMEFFKKSDFEKAGIDTDFVQDNHSKSVKGVLRGLHYQKEPKAQGKLVRCVKGAIFDVAVDIRKGSPTFGRWFAVQLSEENKLMVWIPKGFAHGFLTLTEEAEVIYKVSGAEYSPEYETGIKWNDPDIGIKWPTENIKELILSPKDKNLPFLKDADINFVYKGEWFMKLLITGGAGFIGSEFVRQAVEKGYEVVVVDKLTYAGDLERLKSVEDKIKFYKVDITNREFIEYIFMKEKPKAIVHWAAESHVDRSILDPYIFIHTNVIGTQVLLDVAKESNIEKFINIATDEVYGELGEEGQFFEDTPLKPNSPYSVSKASADMLARAYHKTYRLPVITVRPSNNYGPWQYPEKLIPVIILKAINNEPVPVYGEGKNIREWLYVSDCAEAVFEILEKGRVGEIYNVGSGEERRNIEVVKTILNILGKSEGLIRFVKDRPGHDYRYSLNTKKIESQIGWKAKVKFEEGLQKTVKWYLDNLDWTKKKLKYLKDYWKKVYE